MAATMPAAAVLGALGAGGSELEQAVAVLAAAGVEDPGSLSLGEGDRRLLELALELSARDLELVAVCPACGVPNAVDLRPEDLPPPAPRVAWLGGGGLRGPTFADLRGLPSEPGAAVAELLRRCTVGSPARPPAEDDLDLVDDSLCGPLALACLECSEGIALEADVERLALLRLGECAREREDEVHVLAAAYHWSLHEIESLPDGRRRRLASLVREGR